MILILANSRFKGGLSGGDAIYESFKKYWPCQFSESNLAHIDFKPFALCYLARLAVSIGRALLDGNRYQLVYSSSDFLPDTIPALIYKAKGNKWVAGFYLKAFKENKIHYYSQILVRKLIDWFADMVIVTNPTMYDIFPNKKKTWINGGIDLSLAGLSDKPKIYDAVFCGRIHPSKGIEELLLIWAKVRAVKPNARLALIGDGDLGMEYIRSRMWRDQFGIDLFGYMGDERFNIYKQSKVVLYPTPLKYDHFSMAPVEAMACGCFMICFDNPVNREMLGVIPEIKTIEDFYGVVVKAISDQLLAYDREEPLKFAERFDYQKQSTRVYEDICQQLTLT